MNKNIKKQPFEKEIDGRRMRYCMKYNIWVNREGTYVYREYKDPAWNHALQIHTRPDGSKYLDTKSHGEIPLDEAVAICFSPMPRDGRKYVPVHKDNNPGNCHAFNLTWKQVPKYSPTDKERKLDNGLVVRSDGTILDKRKKLFVITVIGDSDTDRLVSVDPYVCYYRKNRYGSIDERRARVDALMAEAEFVFRAFHNTKELETRHFTPYYLGKANTIPSQNLIDAFPMKASGYPIADTGNSGYDASAPYSGRDNRFYLTVYYHGATYGGTGLPLDVVYGGKDSPSYDFKASRSGYYLAKFLSKKEAMLDPITSTNAQHYYPILRKAEVFLNFAEAANEAWGPKVKGTYQDAEGNTVTCKYSAYDVIKTIRKASGGITDTRYLDEMAADKESFRELIQNERRLELAFENHRYYDMRRWLLPLNEPVRGVEVTEQNGVLHFDTSKEVEARKFDDIRYYYSPLPYNECVKNPNLVNNLGWK